MAGVMEKYEGPMTAGSRSRGAKLSRTTGESRGGGGFLTQEQPARESIASADTYIRAKKKKMTAKSYNQNKIFPHSLEKFRVGAGNEMAK